MKSLLAKLETEHVVYWDAGSPWREGPSGDWPGLEAGDWCLLGLAVAQARHGAPAWVCVRLLGVGSVILCVAPVAWPGVEWGPWPVLGVWEPYAVNPGQPDCSGVRGLAASA